MRILRARAAPLPSISNPSGGLNTFRILCGWNSAGTAALGTSTNAMLECSAHGAARLLLASASATALAREVHLMRGPRAALLEATARALLSSSRATMCASVARFASESAAAFLSTSSCMDVACALLPDTLMHPNERQQQ